MKLVSQNEQVDGQSNPEEERIKEEPDSVIGPHTDPVGDGAVLAHLLRQLLLDPERLVRRLHRSNEQATRIRTSKNPKRPKPHPSRRESHHLSPPVFWSMAAAETLATSAKTKRDVFLSNYIGVGPGKDLAIGLIIGLTKLGPH